METQKPRTTSHLTRVCPDTRQESEQTFSLPGLSTAKKLRPCPRRVGAGSRGVVHGYRGVGDGWRLKRQHSATRAGCQVMYGTEGPTYILSMIRQRIIQRTVNEIKTDETRNDFSTKNKADESRWRDGVSALCDCLKNASKIGRDNTVSALF